MYLKVGLFHFQLLCAGFLVTAIQREDLFPYGPGSGDSVLQDGDDETSEVVKLERRLYFYEAEFSDLYVGTNGIISMQDFPRETQYVDDGFPTEFPVIAPFLADIDTSEGKGKIYYRVDSSAEVLERAALEVKRGFPETTFKPSHVFIVTWDRVGLYEEPTRNSGPSNRVNTFQAVLPYDGTDTYALFLYPENELHFFGTRPKESYNVQLELPARVGFSRGELVNLRRDGPFYSLTGSEQTVKNLYQVGNAGVPGLWIFHIGSSFPFDNVVPPEIATHTSGGPTVVSLDRALSHPGQDSLFDGNIDSESEEYNVDPNYDDEEEEFPSPSLPDQPTAEGHEFPYESLPKPLTTESPLPVPYPHSDFGSLPEDETLKHDLALSTTEKQGDVFPEETTQSPAGHSATYLASPGPMVEVPTETDIPAIYPEEEIISLVHAKPPSAKNRHVVTVDEEVNFDTGVFVYTTENKETCAQFERQCSQHGYCTDYSSGFCCHCTSGYYGNGRHCLPEGVPHRVNGKVSGQISVGISQVDLSNMDLHAYVVVSDGRAYTAISHVPEPAGWALMPVSTIGGLFGWLFALELPDHENGFSIAGAIFTRYAEITFYPGNEKLRVTQEVKGLDAENHLTVHTQIHGHVPFVPPGATVQIEPFKEIYHYHPSVVTSTSTQEYKVISAGGHSETFSYRISQNISYHDCRHAPKTVPDAQQLRLERVFVLYSKDEQVLRYAITNQIGPVGGDPKPVVENPCYSGTHECDMTAQCIPGDGLQYQCQCATGYRGDGTNCFDIDECAEALVSCGSQALCINLQGTHRCECQRGYEFASDGRTCVDVDECNHHNCHPHATCHNTPGSYNCRCLGGYDGDGFQCTPHPEVTSRPKTTCEQHRDSLLVARPGVGAYIPQCDEEGSYQPLQCHGSTGYCWCVDSRGQQRPGTRTSPGKAPPRCELPDVPSRLKTACEQHRDNLQAELNQRGSQPIVGAYIPQCDEEGNYRPLQCHGSTGYCWCVDSRGQELPGTRTPPGSTLSVCVVPVPSRPKTACEHHRDSLQSELSPRGARPSLGMYIPQCDENGNYRPLQCHGSTGYCWCVDSRGQERPGTRTPPGMASARCDHHETTQRPKTACEQHRDRLLAEQNSQEGIPFEGVYIPQCDEAGSYRPLQCHESTSHCWCVDAKGQERPGTRTYPGTSPANCDQPAATSRPKTACERHRDTLLAQLSTQGRLAFLGAYIPQCEEDGSFQPLQCHGSTGHCWCVDSTGVERPGTRTVPGTPPVNCNQPEPTQRPATMCERWRSSLLEHYGGQPAPHHYIPQCDDLGNFSPLQCYGDNSYCWCVDAQGREVSGTRSHSGIIPACLPTVPPPTLQPTPRPDVTPPPLGTVLLYAQGQQIGSLPLNGTRINKEKAAVVLALHGSIVVGIDYDCRERMVYWTDVAGRTISRASLQVGSEPEIIINSGLLSPEGLAVDHVRRKMFWVDSGMDKIETARLDGTERRVLFDTDLVNPRAIVVDSHRGNLYWTDWNREAPKIETSTLDGENRRVLVSRDIGLPNALTFDHFRKQICWADAGTKRLECILPDGSGRHAIHSNLNYPFGMTVHSNHFYYTDWRRDGVIAVSREASQLTDEYLPDQRSHLYGITVALPRCFYGRK
ncbi:nidogen-2 [Polypterus senegalus]|uniref:nidogen-2 n=1 Tax=Polypterus senegalus TaxID=55291 RepID=UPI00196358C9|nr:nidogen-2 [Polypterus senegalus]